MYPFPQAVTPAIQTHFDAQTAFFNDLSKCMFRSFQQMCNLNIQLVQTLLEESATAGQQMLTADRSEMMSAAASRAQPITDKLRAYHQHISRLAADVQVDMARVTEQHVQNTSRTARTLADEVARNASEETERGMRAQQETVRRFADPFARSADGAAQSPMWAGQTSSTMQSGGQGASQAGPAQGKQAGSTANAKGGAQQAH
jgi:phasin family protein